MTVKLVAMPAERVTDYINGYSILADMLHQAKEQAIAAGTWPVLVSDTQPVAAGNTQN
ncbi:MAG: hypothetical protein JZU60_01915 [Ilumatobacteraceae bacterium]|nr:hypothetical protein [Ilumatobacteraceae bacterium]